MSSETTQPQTLTAAANSLQDLSSKLAVCNAAAAAPTTAIAPAGADPISVITASHFGTYATTYQAVFAQGAAALDMFARIVGASAGSPPAAGTTAAAVDD